MVSLSLICEYVFFQIPHVQIHIMCAAVPEMVKY